MLSSAKQLEAVIRDFITSKSSFKLLDSGSSSSLITSKGPLCILDSSFNPPQRAHQIIAQTALNYYSTRSPSLLLLLATSNADKKGQSIEQFAHRVKMMQLMAEEMMKGSDSATPRVHVGLTSHAKFIDKLEAVKSAMETSGSPIVFLVGFDTLIRILDTKYYDPTVPLEQSLAPLMTQAGFFCLTRHPDPVSISQTNYYSTLDVPGQLALSKQIQLGQLPGIPSSWADQIVVTESIDKTDGISSSLVRLLAQQNQDISNYVLPPISRYINDNKLY